MKIFLIGYMGCGKTSLGEKLAKILETKFIDLDSLISRQTNKSITEIFNTEGEDSFRLHEKQALRSLKSVNKAIVATGGGTPCFSDNMEWMNKNGKTIFINLPENVLIKRLHTKFKNNKRPLLKNKTLCEKIWYIKKTWNKRLPYYLKANHIISADSITIEDFLNLDVFKAISS